MLLWVAYVTPFQSWLLGQLWSYLTKWLRKTWQLCFDLEFSVDSPPIFSLANVAYNGPKCVLPKKQIFTWSHYIINIIGPFYWFWEEEPWQTSGYHPMTYWGVVHIPLGNLLPLPCEGHWPCNSAARDRYKKAFAEFSAAWYTPKTMAKLPQIVVMLGTVTWIGHYFYQISVVHGPPPWAIWHFY